MGKLGDVMCESYSMGKLGDESMKCVRVVSWGNWGM